MRDLPIRVWIACGGTVSPWHYDGNSLDGFNVQVRGRKHFMLVSPSTPLACFPLLTEARASFRGEDALSPRHCRASFVLEAGDMLYLPRYWFHRVQALDALNINVNWVWTDADFGAAAPSRTERREGERVAVLVAWASLVNRLRRRRTAALAGYGGSAEGELAALMRRQTTLARLLRRGVCELLACGPTPWALLRRRWTERRLHDGVRRSVDDYFARCPQPTPDRPILGAVGGRLDAMPPG